MTPPPVVEAVRATAAEAPVLANLLELYAHDFSALAGLPLGDDGRFGYPDLPLYWTEPGRVPFLVRADGRLAGFALVSRGSRVSGDPDVWDVAEFFVARAFRRRGVGHEAARQVWRHLPGRWEVRVLEANAPALAFWCAAVSAFTAAPAEGASVEAWGRPWRVFSFSSPGAA